MPQATVTATPPTRPRPYTVDIERGTILEKRASYFNRFLTVAKYVTALTAIAVIATCYITHMQDIQTITSMSQRIEDMQGSPGLPALARFAPVERDDIPAISAYIEENNNATGLLETRQDCNPLSPLCRRKGVPSPDVLQDETCSYFDRWKQYFGFRIQCDSPVCSKWDNFMKHFGVHPMCIPKNQYKKRSVVPVKENSEPVLDGGDISTSKHSARHKAPGSSRTLREPWVDDEWLERYKVYRQQQAEAQQQWDDNEFDIYPRGWFDWLDNGDRPGKLGKVINRVDKNGNIQVYEGGPIYDGDCGAFFDSAGANCVIDPGDASTSKSSS